MPRSVNEWITNRRPDIFRVSLTAGRLFFVAHLKNGKNREKKALLTGQPFTMPMNSLLSLWYKIVIAGTYALQWVKVVRCMMISEGYLGLGDRCQRMRCYLTKLPWTVSSLMEILDGLRCNDCRLLTPFIVFFFYFPSQSPKYHRYYKVWVFLNHFPKQYCYKPCQQYRNLRTYPSRSSEILLRRGLLSCGCRSPANEFQYRKSIWLFVSEFATHSIFSAFVSVISFHTVSYDACVWFLSSYYFEEKWNYIWGK